MPDPGDFKDQDSWMGACVSQMMDEGKAQDQAVAACMNMWSEKSAKKIVRKTHIAEDGGPEFILSDATIDRYGDSISPDGWDTRHFLRNPVCLFNHSPDFPIGRWEGLSVKDGALRGRLKMAPAGTSDRIDEIRKLMDAGILRAVSVGFRPIEAEPLSKSGGQLYKKSELVECSLVAIPANPNSLAVAKSLHISDATLNMVFAEHGKGDLVKRSVVTTNGKHANQKNSPIGKVTKMSTPISVRVEETQNRIVALRDELTKHLDGVDDANPDDDATAITEGYTKQLEQAEKQLDVLRKAEAQLAKAAETTSEIVTRTAAASNNGSEQPMRMRDGRVFASVQKKIRPSDHLFRAVASRVKHFHEGKQRPLIDVHREAYGGEGIYGSEETKVMLDIISRTASTPATTTTSNWASELVQTVIADLLESLIPYSIYPRLRAMGQAYTFGRNGTISIPARTITTTIGGAFVAQGSPIPVKKGAFAAVSLTPLKMGVITTLTREIAEHSQPALEGLLRQAILEDTGVAIDTKLMSTDAAVANTSPPGILNQVTATTASVLSANLDKFNADIAALVKALVTATNGNMRRPVFIMNPGDVTVAAMLATTTGDTPYRDELSRGTLFGIPIIQSTGGTTTEKMILLDAADFATATGDAPRFDVSDQAVLHMEDTTPLPLTTAATASFPIRSLYQTDTMAIRMIVDISWLMLRSGSTVNYIANVGWN